MYEDRFTPSEIKELADNEVFVFGSNVQGEHLGGAAKCAVENFGAVMGEGFGSQGKCFAIPTCNRVGEGSLRHTEPIKDIEEIKSYVNVFVETAKYYNGNIYYVTKIGCGIAGFKVEDIAPLFKECLPLNNVFMPQEFFEVLSK